MWESELVKKAVSDRIDLLLVTLQFVTLDWTVDNIIIIIIIITFLHCITLFVCH